MEEAKQEDILQEDITNWKDNYIRLYADFDNYKKRVIKEREELKNSTKIKALSDILDLDNDLHIAVKMIKDKNSIDAIKVITDKFQHFLKHQGIEEIQTDVYDEDIHEVVSIIQSGKSEIVDVVSKGYKMNGQIVKYPKIILSK